MPYRSGCPSKRWRSFAGEPFQDYLRKPSSSPGATCGEQSRLGGWQPPLELVFRVQNLRSQNWPPSATKLPSRRRACEICLSTTSERTYLPLAFHSHSLPC